MPRSSFRGVGVPRTADALVPSRPSVSLPMLLLSILIQRLCASSYKPPLSIHMYLLHTKLLLHWPRSLRMAQLGHGRCR